MMKVYLDFQVLDYIHKELSIRQFFWTKRSGDILLVWHIKKNFIEQNDKKQVKRKLLQIV